MLRGVLFFLGFTSESLSPVGKEVGTLVRLSSVAITQG
jgi:hypothetical protein